MLFMAKLKLTILPRRAPQTIDVWRQDLFSFKFSFRRDNKMPTKLVGRKSNAHWSEVAAAC